MTRVAFLLISIGFMYTEAGAHGLHISLGKAEVTEAGISGKITLNKLDFVEAIDQWDSDTPIYELTPEEFEKLTLRYMKRHFKVEGNGRTDLKLVIKEAGQGMDTMWLTFRFLSKRPLETIRVEHRVLFNVFPDQANVLAVTSGKGKESFLFRVDQPVKVFSVK